MAKSKCNQIFWYLPKRTGNMDSKQGIEVDYAN